MSLRSLKREVIRNKCYHRDGNYKSFADDWERFNYSRIETENDDEIISESKRRGKKRKKIQHHLDNKREIFNMLVFTKDFINKKKEERKNKKELEKGELVNG